VKIAILINTSWNIYNFRLGMLREFKADGHKVVCIAPRDDYSKKLEEEGFEYHHISINNKGTNPIEDFKLIYDYYRLLSIIEPDIVLGYTIKPNIYGSIASHLLGIPTISNITGLGTVFLNDNVSSKFAMWLYKIALYKSIVFFQNRDDLNIFLERGLVESEYADVLPGSGIDLKKFSPRRVDRRDGRFKFLMIARLLKDKGIMEYVKASREIKGKSGYDYVDFLLIGAIWKDNPTAVSKDDVDSWEREGIIKYLGVTDDIREKISEVDTVVLPSYREGTPRTLLESASMAKPLIATDVAGCRDVVDDGVNGYLCRVKDYRDLADKMDKMLSLSDEEREKMGMSGRRKMEMEFNEKIVIHKYINYINIVTRNLYWRGKIKCRDFICS